MLDKDDLLRRATAWMLDRNWKRLTAKRRQFDQSLFEHTMMELDAMLQLLPILREPKHFGLSESEEQVLLVSVVAHDVGKQRDEWQDYILGRRGFVSDVDPGLTQSVLPELCAALGLSGVDERVMPVIENCVNLHMQHERSTTNVMAAMLQGADRWLTLANLVYHVDNVASAKGVLEAQRALERSSLAKHLRTAYHLVSVRGVSTTMLHRAALDAFKEAGWTPLLHFADATLYVCSSAQPLQQPARSQIDCRLSSVLRSVTGRDVARFMVGSPTANILPKSDLFDYREMRTYLQAAAGKIGRGSFLRKKEAKRKPVILKYLELRKRDKEITDEELVRQSERISSAHPDMVVFKFFKAAMSKDMVGASGVCVAHEHYDLMFGQGAWSGLMSTSTLDAAKDMQATVDRFWELPGERFGLHVGSVEQLDPNKRTQLLIDVLCAIASSVYDAIPHPPTRDQLADKMAAAFLQDLIHPALALDIADLARHQTEAYAASKPVAGKQVRMASYMCPICNTPFENGIKASADFIDKPESHTNRGIAHGAFGYIMVCTTCKFESFLRQLLLGERAKELIVILPRMNIGPDSGEILVHKVGALYDRAYAVMVGDTNDPDRRIWLPFTPEIAERACSEDIYRLSVQELADLLSYRSNEERRAKNRRDLEKALREEYEDVTAANAEWGTEFPTWESAIEAVQAGQVEDQTARRIREEVYRLHAQIGLVCQTPHLIMLPLSYEIALGKDADTNQALRRVFIALVLGITLDASVAIVRDSDIMDFHGGEGVAYVPPVGNARGLLGGNWIPISDAERWLRAIGLASILAEAGQYSERTGLFEVLTAPTAGHILRRIEQKRAADGRPLTLRDITYLRRFEEIHR